MIGGPKLASITTNGRRSYIPLTSASCLPISLGKKATSYFFPTRFYSPTHSNTLGWPQRIEYLWEALLQKKTEILLAVFRGDCTLTKEFAKAFTVSQAHVRRVCEEMIQNHMVSAAQDTTSGIVSPWGL